MSFCVWAWIWTASVSLAQQAAHTSLEEAFKAPNTVRKLVLSGKGLTELPAGLESFPNLKWLDLSRNKLTRFPVELIHLPALETLDLGR
ncbi:MAG: leucine-rich repeat domain-containing protein, partial [Bacteroidia bacterium]|nr:leucine-rich repeat domain-containing protein [Bacteroidia bacterium]